MPVGLHRADLRRAGEAPTATPTLSGSFEVRPNERITIAALLDPSGKPTWLAFPNDAAMADTARAEIRFRHFAAAGPVNVTLDDSLARQAVPNMASATQIAPARARARTPPGGGHRRGQRCCGGSDRGGGGHGRRSGQRLPDRPGPGSVGSARTGADHARRGGHERPGAQRRRPVAIRDWPTRPSPPPPPAPSGGSARPERSVVGGGRGCGRRRRRVRLPDPDPTSTSRPGVTGRRHRTGRWRWAAACLLTLAGGATGCGRLPEPSPEARAWAADQRTNEGTTQRTTEWTTDAGPSPGGPAPAGASGGAPIVNQPMAPAPASVPPPTTDLGPPGSALAESEAWTGQLPPGAVALAAEAARPVRVRVAALGVDAPVVAAGVAADGQLELPADAATVAWFIGGAVPGDSGSAVLAAHVDFGGDARCVLRPGRAAGRLRHRHRLRRRRGADLPHQRRLPRPMSRPTYPSASCSVEAANPPSRW